MANINNISKINLYCQKLKLHPPYFEVLKKEGEDHHPIFKVSCAFEDQLEIGTGFSLKTAKEDAATEIVELLNIDHKLKEFENNVMYTVDSYNAPLKDVWENTAKEYTLTLKKRNKNQYEYKKFKVIIMHETE